MIRTSHQRNGQETTIKGARLTVDILFVGCGSNNFASTFRSFSSCDVGASSSASFRRDKTSHFMLTLALSDTEFTLVLKTESSGSCGVGSLTIRMIGMVLVAVVVIVSGGGVDGRTSRRQEEGSAG